MRDTVIGLFLLCPTPHLWEHRSSLSASLLGGGGVKPFLLQSGGSLVLQSRAPSPKTQTRTQVSRAASDTEKSLILLRRRVPAPTGRGIWFWILFMWDSLGERGRHRRESGPSCGTCPGERGAGSGDPERQEDWAEPNRRGQHILGHKKERQVGQDGDRDRHVGQTTEGETETDGEREDPKPDPMDRTRDREVSGVRWGFGSRRGTE